MKRKNREKSEVRSNSPPKKKREPHDRQGSKQHEGANLEDLGSNPEIDTPELGRGKRRRAPRQKIAVQPNEQKNKIQGPIEPKELPADLQAGNEGDAQRRRSSVIQQQLLKLLGDISPTETNRLWEAAKDNIRPMPPGFQQSLSKLRAEGKLSEAVEQYHLNLGRKDSLRVPGEGGRKSLLEEVLGLDPQEAERSKGGSQGSGWKPTKKLGQGGCGYVILWEHPRRNGPVWL